VQRRTGEKGIWEKGDREEEIGGERRRRMGKKLLWREVEEKSTGEEGKECWSVGGLRGEKIQEDEDL
jgi:hypothetical protein